MILVEAVQLSDAQSGCLVQPGPLSEAEQSMAQPEPLPSSSKETLCLNEEGVHLEGNVCASSANVRVLSEELSSEGNVCSNPGDFSLSDSRRRTLADNDPQFSSAIQRYIQSKNCDPRDVWRAFFNGSFRGSTVDEAITFLEVDDPDF